MPPKRVRVPAAAAAISPREARLRNRSRAPEPTPPASKRGRTATPRPARVAPVAVQNQPQVEIDQVGALLRTVDALTAAVRAQSARNTPAPVASDNRRPEGLLLRTVDDPLAFGDTAADGLTNSTASMAFPLRRVRLTFTVRVRCPIRNYARERRRSSMSIWPVS